MTKKEELVNYLKDRFGVIDENGDYELDLSGLDFGTANINLSGLKANTIDNKNQEGTCSICNSNQKTKYLFNTKKSQIRTIES